MPDPDYCICFIVALVFVVTEVNAQSNTTGFNREVLFDESRSYGEGQRPIVINYWYPAKRKSNKTSFTFKDYILAGSRQADLSTLTSQDEHSLVDLFRTNLDYFNVTDSQFSKILLKPAAPGLATAPLKSKFPLVVLVGGVGGSNGMFTTWAEQLSANGMVVITLSSFGENDSTACGYDLTCIQNQVKDIAYAVHVMSEKPFVDKSKISIVAWSFGGLSALLYHAEYQKVCAILSVDSALGYKYGIDLLNMHHLSDGINVVPVLHFASVSASKRIPHDYSILEKINATITFDSLYDHADYTSLYNEVLRYGTGIPDAEMKLNRDRITDTFLTFTNWSK